MTAQSNGDYANIERARSALSYLDPTNRDVWVRTAMCIKDGFGDAGFEMWDAWGSQCDSHTASSAKSVWKSVKVNGKLKIASLFYDAKAAGWTDSTKYKKPTQAEIDARNAQAAVTGLEGVCMLAPQGQRHDQVVTVADAVEAGIGRQQVPGFVQDLAVLNDSLHRRAP